MPFTSYRLLVLLTAVALVPTLARAQHLDWSAPAGCPDAAAVQSAIDHAAGSVGRQSSVSVDAEVEQLASGYALTLGVQTATGTSGERLVAEDCSLFVRLIALKVSLLVTDSTNVGAVPLAADGGRWSVRAQGLVATMPVPSPAFGVALGAGYRIGPLRIELLGSYLFPRRSSFAEQPEAGGTFHAWSAGLRACGVSPWPRAADSFELAGCGGVEGGLLRGRGFGVSPAKISDRPFMMLSAGVSVTVPLAGMLAVRADVDLLFGLVRPDFFVRNLGTLHRVARIGTRGFLGIELRWP